MTSPAVTSDEVQAPLYGVLALTVLALFVASAPNLLDPIVRHDDFPALIAEPKGYYLKTLEEGRWINYLWHLREVVTPSWLNFAVYQLCWAIFAAALAVTAFGRHAHPLYVTALAILIIVAPPALMISLWFNTLIPGLAIVAGYAALGCYLNPRTMRFLLWIFVPATLMTYTTYPLLLLAVCMVQRDTQRSIWDLVKLASTFVASFALGLMAIYALNYIEHGVFGVVMAEWRNPTPANDLASLVANLPAFYESVSLFVSKTTFEFTPAAYFHGAFLIIATYVLAKRDKMLVLYLYTGLFMGLALVTLQVLKTGVVVQARAMIFAWVFYALIIGYATLAMATAGELKARLFRNGMILIAASYLLQTGMIYSGFRAWQADTRAIAEAMEGQTGPIYISGDYRAIPSADKAGIQHLRGLYARLYYLTKRPIIVCDEAEECPSDADINPSALVTVVAAGDGTLVKMAAYDVAKNGSVD